MQRRDFVKLISAASLAPLFSFSSDLDLSLFNELTGKALPELYGDTFKLRKEVAECFVEMRSAAELEGIKLFSASSYRNYDHQKRIWDQKHKKFTKEGLSEIDVLHKLIEYSTLPGTSRHHWGTDLDIIDLAVKPPVDALNEIHFNENGVYSKLYEWLQKNANNYGFYEVYTLDTVTKPCRKSIIDCLFNSICLILLKNRISMALNCWMMFSSSNTLLLTLKASILFCNNL
jgi:D-alanyl-D-alanine carboxypeptidase